MKRTNKKGFTIVELVIVIAVIAILAAVLIPNISRLVKKANESADIQAVRNMNTFLAAESVTGNINSILDVYDLFTDSGYNVDSYSPLYSGRHFYYDKQYNQILYVDTESKKVLFPEERKNDTLTSLKAENHDLFSLSMEVPVFEEVTITNSDSNDTMSATVSTAGQLSFVIDKFNKSSGTKTLSLTVSGTIDMMGAQCRIDKSDAKEIKITGTYNAVIKNITSNKFGTTSTANASGKEAKYYAGAIVGDALKATVTIENVEFENLHVKNTETGSAALLIGACEKAIINKVTIKNSSVIGHRGVGALIGYVNHAELKGAINLENVSVETVGGRSALLIGQLNDTQNNKSNPGLTVATDCQITLTNSKLSVYENAASKQKFSNKSETPAEWGNEFEKYTIKNQDQYIFSVKTTESGNPKTYSVYGYKADALILVNTGNRDKWEAFTATDALLKDHIK